MSHTQIRLLLRIVDEAYQKGGWNSPNLRGSLRGVRAPEAAWRPAPGRHNIREIVLHLAYWKYVVRRRLLGGTREGFSFPGTDWFERPGALSEKLWRQDVVLLDQQHRKLREAAAGLPPAKLHKPALGSKGPNVAHILSAAHHDFYHAGQIQLLKRLRRASKKRRKG